MTDRTDPTDPSESDPRKDQKPTINDAATAANDGGAAAAKD